MEGIVEVKVLVKRYDCKVMEYLHDKKLIISRVVARDKFSDHLINGQITSEMEKRLRNSGIKTIRMPDNTIWVRASSCSACKFLGSSDAIILDAKPLSKHEIVYRLIVPSPVNLEQIMRELEELGLDPKIVELKRLLPANKRSAEELTNRQLQALILAYKKGYFDDDRKITLSGLAKILGISPSSTQELMKRAMKKVVKAYLKRFEENP